jgi:porin-like protein
VKICTLYGAGFYYLPGTDICVKHGAYVRSQWYFGAGASPTNGPFAGASGQNADFQGGAAVLGTPNQTVHRTRAIYTLDARTQTEYGTLRAYTIIGYTHESPQTSIGGNTTPTLYATRAFLQFAGFTLGKASSFYDIWSSPAVSYFSVPSSDSGDGGVMLWAYTFQFGNGFSGTIAAEDQRRNSIVNTSLGGGPGFPLAGTAAANPFSVGASPLNDAASMKFPDLVANLRVDQAWGSFQVMGALHDNSAGYWVPSTAAGLCNVGAFGGTLTGQLACGAPDDKLGFAVGVGGIFKIPMPGGLTDTASFQVNYTEGANRYAAITQPGGGTPNYFSGTGVGACPTFGPAVAGLLPGCQGSIGLGYWTDGVYGNPGALPGYDGSVQNTRMWGVNASWDHLWTPNLKTSVYGSYIAVEYNSTAAALIANATCGVSGATANTVTRMTNCDPDFQVWMVGTRTQWNITPSFYVGFDVAYSRLETAFTGSALYTAATGLPRNTGTYTIEDQDVVSATVRAHWDILP